METQSVWGLGSVKSPEITLGNKLTSLTQTSLKTVTATEIFPIASLPPGSNSGDTPMLARDWCLANPYSERVLNLSPGSFQKLSDNGIFDLISEITDWFLGDGEEDIVYDREHIKMIYESLHQRAESMSDPDAKYLVRSVANLAELSYDEGTPLAFIF